MSDELTITLNGQQVIATRAEWGSVVEQVQADRAAAWEAWHKRQDAASQVWKAHYWRYYCEYWDEHYSVASAASALHGGSENGDLAPRGIVFPDGHEEADYEAYLDQADEYDQGEHGYPPVAASLSSGVTA